MPSPRRPMRLIPNPLEINPPLTHPHHIAHVNPRTLHRPDTQMPEVGRRTPPQSSASPI